MAEKPAQQQQQENVEADIDGSNPTEEAGVTRREDYHPAPLGGVSGSAMDQVSFRLPRLKIAYGVGALAEIHNQGDLVLNIGGKDGDNHLLAPKGEAVGVILLAVDSYWKEYIGQDDWQNGVRPREFLSKEEIEANGGTWKMPPYGSGKPLPTFGGAAHIKLLIEKPEAVICGAFGITLGDREFAPAVWSVDKGAYRSVAPTIKNDRGFALRERGLLSVTYALQTSVQTKGTNTRVIPRIKITQHHSNEFLEELKTLLKEVSFEVPDEDAEPMAF